MKKFIELVNAMISENQFDDSSVFLQSRLADKYNLTFDGEFYNSDHGIECEPDLVKDGELIIPFGTIDGDFDCSDLGLRTLKNSPREVNGCFQCNYNELTSLVNGPDRVGELYDCSSNNLTSFIGIASEIGYLNDSYGTIDCMDNPITSLEGAPKGVEIKIKL